MSTRYAVIPACCTVIILILLGAGCTTTSIGDVAYNNNTLVVSVDNTGELTDAFVQVTVYRIKDFSQQKQTVIEVPVTFHRGQNRILIPESLLPGSYKLYVYILKPDGRQTATIRDIVV
jgi:hypothetical protein